MFLLLLLLFLGLAGLLVLYWMRHRTQLAEQRMDRTMQHYHQQPLGPSTRLTDMVDRIEVIAIPSRVDYITSTLTSYGLTTEDYHFVKPTLKASIKKRHALMSSGEVACYKSHMQALKDFLADPQAQTCLVLEDDLQPCPNLDLFQRRLGDLQQELSSPGAHKWDILYLGRCMDSCFLNKPVSKQLVKRTAPLCLHAYVVSRRGAKRIRDTGRAAHVPIDAHVLKLGAQGRLRVLSVSPALFYQNKQVQSTLGHGRVQPECMLSQKDNYKKQK